MANFKEAYLLTKDNEGGYANVKGDTGGETYAGIARNSFPDWEGWTIIDEIKKSKKLSNNEHIPNKYLESAVYGFFELEFWDKKVLGDQILDQQVANQIYDWIVTSGKAREEIQKAIGIPSKEVDGKFGPKTIKVINTGNSESIFNMIKVARINYYTKISKLGYNSKFLKGWLARANRFVYKTVRK